MNSRKFTDVIARVSAMSTAEISDRLRQEIAKRMDVALYRSAATDRRGSKSLASSCLSGTFFFDSADIPDILSALRQRLPGQVQSIVAEAEQICAHRFRLLGFADVQYGPTIDWHLDAVHQRISPRRPWFKIDYFDANAVGDPKITWELNRHQHLTVLAKAFRLSGNRKFAEEMVAQWYSWREQNRYPIGINWASSLEVAFRSMSWLWAWFLLKDTDTLPPDFASDLVDGFSTAGRHIERYLSTYTSPNTHLLGEAVGLFFIGTLCPGLAASARWQKKAWQIILNEAKNQVRPDGFHFEQSTYYHVYALDFFLHARMLASRNAVLIPEWFDETLQRMLEVLRCLGQAGAPPSFGDDDGGRVFDSNRNRREHLLDPLATGAVLFSRTEFKAAVPQLTEESVWLLGAGTPSRFDNLPAQSQPAKSCDLASSGAYIMTNSRGEQLVIDAGPQGTHTAGHGHADALSIHLSADGRELLTDPGTFEYSGEGRSWFRSTAAHNTLKVDGLDQAEARTPFSWKALPTTCVERWIAGRNFDVFHGSHDGYERLESPVTHERWVINFKAGVWLVRDVAVGQGKHELDIAWHLAPQAESGVTIRSAQSGWTTQLADEWWSPAYGVKVSTKTLHHTYCGPLPAESGTVLTCAVPAVTDSVRQSSGSNSSVIAYECEAASCDCIATFSGRSQRWQLGDWSSDADLLCAVIRDRHIEALLLCNGTYVEWQGRRLLSAEHKVSWCEIVRHGAAFEICSPDQQIISVAADSVETVVAAESGRTVT